MQCLAVRGRGTYPKICSLFEQRVRAKRHDGSASYADAVKEGLTRRMAKEVSDLRTQVMAFVATKSKQLLADLQDVGTSVMQGVRGIAGAAAVDERGRRELRGWSLAATRLASVVRSAGQVPAMQGMVHRVLGAKQSV